MEITEVVLVLCNVVNNNCQQNSRVLYTFVPDKWIGELLDISPKNVISLKTFNLEFSRYTVQSKNRIFVKGYGFLSFVKKSFSSKKGIQKTAEATGGLIGNKNADKITKVSKRSPRITQKREEEILRERYISPE